MEHRARNPWREHRLRLCLACGSCASFATLLEWAALKGGMNMKALAKTVVALLVLLGLTVPSFSQVTKKTPGDENAAMGKVKKDSMKGKMKEPIEKKAK